MESGVVNHALRKMEQINNTDHPTSASSTMGSHTSSNELQKPRKAVTFKTGLILERNFRPRSMALTTVEKVNNYSTVLSGLYFFHN